VGVESVRVFEASDLAPGFRSLGGLELELECSDHARACTLRATLRNRGSEPIALEGVTLHMRWRGHAQRSHRFLRHGWQSWSLTQAQALDGDGTPEFPSGAWLRGMHHCLGEQAADRVGWHESHTLSAIAGDVGGPACVAGVLESGQCFGLVHLLREDETDDERPVRIDVELRLEVPLEPGEVRRLDAVRVAVGEDPSRLLEDFAELWGREANARRSGAFRSGWCSWYQFFHAVSEEDLLRNLDGLVAAREQGELSVDVVQLDDGYQRALGDWLETNEKFPSGLPKLADAIRSAGFAAGIWTAPFAVSRESALGSANPAWMLGAGDGNGGWLRGTLNPEWTAEGWCYVLDPSRPEVTAHLEGLFRELVALGFDYLKLDFLYMPAMYGVAHDPRLTRAERLGRGLQAIRAGAGEGAFLLGCGSPLGPAVGWVDGMRIGPDVAPSWGVDAPLVVPGLESTLPSTHNALRSISNRAFMHRRLWQNDPDCLMVRTRDTALAPFEIHSLAAAIAITGGLPVFSDDLPLQGELARRGVQATIDAARAVDGAALVGGARVLGLLDEHPWDLVIASEGTRATVAAINTGDARLIRRIPLESIGLLRAPGKVAPVPLTGAEPGVGASVADGFLELDLPAHQSAVLQLERARELALFCDFDGTFSVQDVGSTLAQQHLGDRRIELWQRYDRGELDAWEYAVELFRGFALPPAELDAFLGTIDLDPGARALVDWCGERSVPLRILSDGFDYNLDRLQSIHEVAFEYTANHLEPDPAGWRLSPGARNPGCACGTGSCKRGLIQAWRAQHPGSFCVHVGNGRVSDLCGAEEADLAFAKDTLAPALDERGGRYRPFETLHDVLGVLDGLV
jgi:2-hydroxy-3-keto-5-methylthiopentenyl-1-phosphate phosphatase